MANSMGLSARNLSLKAHFGADKAAGALPILYLALFKGNPSGTGVEPDSTGGYGRAAVDNDAVTWGTIASDAVSVSNQIEIAFPQATGLWSITDPLDWWGIFDLTTGGELWYWGELDIEVTVTGTGDQPRFPIDQFQLVQAASG